ncbi:MAG TPA: hypothetical protein DEQ47_05635 [Solibacterales bacterium]|nr:hypothetical protein [Bryobacterales bacterium]
MPLNGCDLSLYFNHVFQIVPVDSGHFKVRSEGYAYRVDRPSESGTPEEVISYHWHPHLLGGPEFPHMHVHASGRDKHLARVHFPTGRMSIERLVLFLIREYGAMPTVAGGESLVRENLQRLENAWRWF